MKENDTSSTPLPSWTENSFPNFTRHGKHSLLKEFLTREIYNELKDKTTKSGVTLEDVIRSGVSLPYGPTQLGVFAGDAESYTTFDALLHPIIERHHHAIRRKHLQRFRTNLKPEDLVQRRLDPDGEYILYTRMRLARSIAGFRFAPCISRAERREVERLLQSCVSDWGTENGDGAYRTVLTMSNKQHEDLVRRQLLFENPDESAIAAGLARDWPDGRGLFCDSWNPNATPSLILWCNHIDHVWIISNAKGGDVQGVFSRMSKAVMALETALKARGHCFVEDRGLGFLNTSPADIGTALRASVYIKLVRLGAQPGFHDLMQRLRLEARAEEYNNRYTGIFDIGNAEALGKTEVQLINIMIQGVGICIDLERRLEKGEKINLDEIEVEKLMS
jgi:creatine kinase